MPYSLGVDRLERIDPSKVKSKLSEDEERKLTTDMRELFDRLIPTEKVRDNRAKLVAKLETLFNEEWPGHDIRVRLFGSSGNKLCSDDSDGTWTAGPMRLRFATTNLWQWISASRPSGRRWRGFA